MGPKDFEAVQRSIEQRSARNTSKIMQEENVGMSCASRK